MSHFVEGFLMIGQYISAKLVTQEIVSMLVEQRDIDNCSSCLMLHKNTTLEFSSIKPQTSWFTSAVWVDGVS